jgi:hypothetical protein
MAPNSAEKTAVTLPALEHKGEETKKPKFDKENVTVIFVLGDPGAGEKSKNSSSAEHR